MKTSLMITLLLASAACAHAADVLRPFAISEDPPEAVELAKAAPAWPPARPGTSSLERRAQWLMFTADWCASCRVARNDFEAWLQRSGWIIDESPRAHIRLVDADRQPALVSAYRVSAFPTFVLLQDGREVFRLQGYPGRSELVRRLQQAVHAAPAKKVAAVQSRERQRPVDLAWTEALRRKPRIMDQRPNSWPPVANARGSDFPIGTLTGQRDNIAKILWGFRTLLGAGGTLTVTLDRREMPAVLLPISDRCSIRVANPLTATYSLQGDVLTCRFSEPYPRGRFTVGLTVEQPISAISLSVSEVTIELPRAPDVRLRVES